MENSHGLLKSSFSFAITFTFADKYQENQKNSGQKETERS